MRLFIAVEVSPENKEKISILQKRLKWSDADVKWVNPKNLHITLKFLGETEETVFNELYKEIRKNLFSFNGFDLIFSKIGFFPIGLRPNEKFPKVIWVGIEKGKDELKKISEIVEGVAVGFGFEKEKRPFSPHLTIGRFRTQYKKDNLPSRSNRIKKVAAGLETQEFAGQKVREVLFIKSILKPEGPEYTVLEKITLLPNAKVSP